MEIRPFRTSDQQAVIRLWEACNLLRAWNDPQLDIVRKQAVGADLFLVGVIEDQIVACVMGGYDGHRGWMNYLAVSPTHQRRGLARMIVDELEQRLHSLGCPKLNLQVRGENQQVIRFYERLGYSVDDAVSLGKRLISDLPDETD